MTTNSIPRGKIKEYRDLLNSQDNGTVKWRNGRYRQTKRLYGDYLYNQDREHFMFSLREWLLTSGQS